MVKVVRNAVQSFGDSVVPLGDAVTIRLGGIEVVLGTVRAQVFDPDVFSNMGVRPDRQGHAGGQVDQPFSTPPSPRIASEILYVAIDGIYPNDPPNNGYRNLRRPIWPIVPRSVRVKRRTANEASGEKGDYP